MPRIQSPWYKSRISWRHLPWTVISAAGVWGAWLLISSGSFFAGLLLFLISLALLWGSGRTLWRNRQPFVFAVRGDRKVKFRGGGRDETIFEEGGRKVKIFTELSGVGTGRAIYANSIQRYEAPYDGELIHEERKENILDLLCEEFDYRGQPYEVIMTSRLSVKMPCPRCGEVQEFELQLPFGCIGERHYRIGDKIEWQADRLPKKGGRPDNGICVKKSGRRAPRAVVILG